MFLSESDCSCLFYFGHFCMLCLLLGISRAALSCWVGVTICSWHLGRSTGLQEQILALQGLARIVAESFCCMVRLSAPGNCSASFPFQSEFPKGYGGNPGAWAKAKYSKWQGRPRLANPMLFLILHCVLFPGCEVKQTECNKQTRSFSNECWVSHSESYTYIGSLASSYKDTICKNIKTKSTYTLSAIKEPLQFWPEWRIVWTIPGYFLILVLIYFFIKCASAILALRIIENMATLISFFCFSGFLAVVAWMAHRIKHAHVHWKIFILSPIWNYKFVYIFHVRNPCSFGSSSTPLCRRHRHRHKDTHTHSLSLSLSFSLSLFIYLSLFLFLILSLWFSLSLSLYRSLSLSLSFCFFVLLPFLFYPSFSISLSLFVFICIFLFLFE